ncbi:hypothetical protein M2137_003042 [Parabacteroides sp. PFB2-10]|uniref:DUF3298 and DUF4163 domain-containing protein n=1 Tax=Parabacteroides sp. PFB2-10 TaxID=1742405 RepID=UPI002475EA4C|nr:DUF3298 and DUF4163 domain-containing protein [Parabacteroides sp. PFB2-10]MDH6314243.1 hypothetical protein [Parabacteroides sp. PFB2-10]MDL2244270.1 DUF3298 and DUF4163 domain-containing protein [Parabacteroides sp. OttesenSCG-928-J18]
MRTQLCKGFVGILCILGMLTTGCQTGTRKKAENDIKFTTIDTEKTYHLLNNPDNPNCDFQLNFTYPTEYSDKGSLEKLQSLFVYSYFGEAYEMLSPEAAAEKYTNDYLEMYKELEEYFEEELKSADEEAVGSWYGYFETSNNEVVYNKGGILSYIVSYENYTGGAHGAHTVTNHIIDLESMAFLKEEDVFVENFENPLAQLLVEEITANNNLTDSKELEEIGFFSVEEIYPNDNFYADEEGITYTFNEYEIAAYAVGVTQVKLPYAKIKHLLQKESPLLSIIAP